MLKKTFGVLLLSCLFFGCSSVAHLKTDDEPNVTFQPNIASNIKVYSTTKSAKNYQIIGQVIANADAGSDSEKAVDLLKEEAAKLGANAIFNLRLEIDSGEWNNAIKATGLAVKYN